MARAGVFMVKLAPPLHTTNGILASVKISDPFPFHGFVVWLTTDRGGRRSGPPTSPYSATAFVPPVTVAAGLASFVLRDFDSTVFRSSAVGRWLTVANEGVYSIKPGTVVVVTEGPRTVANFHVEHVSSTTSVVGRDRSAHVAP
jgi:hypothetical protein